MNNNKTDFDVIIVGGRHQRACRRALLISAWERENDAGCWQGRSTKVGGHGIVGVLIPEAPEHLVPPALLDMMSMACFIPTIPQGTGLERHGFKSIEAGAQAYGGICTRMGSSAGVSGEIAEKTARNQALQQE